MTPSGPDRRKGRLVVGLVAGASAWLAIASALAGTPDRDKAWDALVTEAKKHGGAATAYKTSTSLVFQQKDGFFITVTEVPDAKARAVCAMSKYQSVIVCGNWDTGALKYGWRADTSSPWSYSDKPPEPKSLQANPFGGLLSTLTSLMKTGS